MSGYGATRLAGGSAPETLHRKVSRGLRWSLGNNLVARLSNVAVGIILARLLAPADYGVFAAALLLVNAALSMNELGVSLAIIRWPGPTARIAPTVTTLALAWSLTLYAVCWVVSPTLASALGSPGSAALIRVLALCVVADAAASVAAASLARAFMQRERALVDGTCLVVSSAVSVALAMRGWGAWALAAGLLASSVLSAALTVVVAPERHPPGFSRQVARELVAFGLPLAGASALTFLSLNVDYVVVGHELGAEALGFYMLAFNMCSWPVTLISVALRRVSFAGFSRVEEADRGSGPAFVRASGLVVAVTFPLCALLAAYAHPAIRFLYGDRWLPAADVLVLLSVLGAVRVLLELGYDYLAAAGRGRANLVIQGVWFAVLVPVLLTGATADGIRGVAAGHGVVALLVVTPLFLWCAARAGADVGLVLRLAVRPLMAVLAVAATAWLAGRWLPSTATQLFVGGLGSALVAGAVVLPVRHLVRGNRLEPA